MGPQLLTMRAYSVRVPRKARASRVIVAPSHANDPLLPLRVPEGAKVVDPGSFVPFASTTVAAPSEGAPAAVAPAGPKAVVAARNGMTVETFLKTIGRGVEEAASKFKTWDELVTSDGDAMKAKGVKVRQRRWILNWVEKYRTGVEVRRLSWGWGRGRFGGLEGDSN